MKYILLDVNANGLPQMNEDKESMNLKLYIRTGIEGAPEGKFIQRDDWECTISPNDSIVDIQKKMNDSALQFIKENYG